MKERRKIERFTLELPAKIEIMSPEVKQVFNLMTANISSEGAYFHMIKPIKKDTYVKVTIRLNIELVKSLTGYEGILKTIGKVIRSNGRGMAIAFEQDFHANRIDYPGLSSNN